MSRRITLPFALTVLTLAACSDDATSPTQSFLKASSARDTTTSTPSTPSTPTTPTTPSDTAKTPPTYPASVRVTGRVLQATWTQGMTAGDTVLSSFSPVSGARVTLYRNLLVGGKGVSEKVGEKTTGADGKFVFENAPGGPYVVSLNVTPAQFYGEAFTYLMGNAAEVSVDLKVYRRAQ